jgi:hypothetical protein
MKLEGCPYWNLLKRWKQQIRKRKKKNRMNVMNLQNDTIIYCCCRPSFPPNRSLHKTSLRLESGRSTERWKHRLSWDATAEGGKSATAAPAFGGRARMGTRGCKRTCSCNFQCSWGQKASQNRRSSTPLTLSALRWMPQLDFANTGRQLEVWNFDLIVMCTMHPTKTFYRPSRLPNVLLLTYYYAPEGVQEILTHHRFTGWFWLMLICCERKTLLNKQW